MGQLVVDNYFIEYEYTEDDHFEVFVQELLGSDKVYTYIFKILSRTNNQDADLIGDAIYWHEQVTKENRDA